MRSGWIFVLLACVWSPALGTYQHSGKCLCNGKAQYCVQDSLGLRCENCQGNTEGRHCENCKEGFYHQRAGENCQPCYCNPAGSVGEECSSRGQCVCKPGVQGSRCDRCANGAPVTAQGCGSQRLDTCFCNGHSSECSPARGYSVYNITATFDQGMEGWQPVTAPTVNRAQVTSRWSPAYHNIEVISKDLMPVYLSAPGQYLGNQVLSYGQTLSFSLRLDRGVRHPSTSDVVLEGAGRMVSASLGSLRNVIPCGKKITYAFRLDEQPASRWKPQLSSTEFQTLLSDLTAIKIRGTFGENGRGYLDDVVLVSARPGSGTPAAWVKKCRCPAGYDGEFCEYCATGYKRRFPGRGRRSPCEPCSCRGGSCDPETGDCYSADETGPPCPAGFYDNPRQPGTCLRCPCPQGQTCLVPPGTLDVICNCPPGTRGSRCQKCDDGFFGDPQGERGFPQPCRPCQCNGHTDLNSLSNCDDVTGECLKCMNNTRGWSCEDCVEGFYHRRPTDACQACNCNLQGALSRSCSDQGQCRCREGFEGLRCDRSACPSCFNPVKNQMEKYVRKLQELEALFNGMGSGGAFNSSALEKALSTAEETVQYLQRRANTLSDTEELLYNRLLSLSTTHSKQERRLQDIFNTMNSTGWDWQFSKDVADIWKLISTIRQNLIQAKSDLNRIELPQRDAEPVNNTMTSLVQKATDLAQRHQNESGSVEQTANHALSTSENASALVNPILKEERSLANTISFYKTQFEKDAALVKALEEQAPVVNGAAVAESKVALDTLKLISELGKNLTAAPQEDVAGLVGRLNQLKDSIQSNATSYEDLQKDVLANRNETAHLLEQAKAAQQAQEKLLSRANAAKAKADQAVKLFDSLGSVDEDLDKLRGFGGRISSGKAAADEALRKLPLINSTIQQAMANNAKTQDVLGSLGDYREAQDTLDKLDNTLSRIEKMSTSGPSSSDLLATATLLKTGMEGLTTEAGLTMNQLTREKQDAEKTRKLAEKVNQDANEVYKGARDTRTAVADTLATVNNLIKLLGNPAAVDDKKVAELERAVANSRSLVDNELRPKLTQLEDKEAQQRATIQQMISDIGTILLDIKNLEHINQTIPDGCYNIQPKERP